MSLDLTLIDCHTHIGRLPGVVGDAYTPEDLCYICEREGTRFMLVSSATATTVGQRLATDEAIAGTAADELVEPALAQNAVVADTTVDFVVARARQDESVPKLANAGADRVVNPQELGAARMASFVSRPNVAEFIDVVMHERSLEFRMQELAVEPDSPLAGCTLREANLPARTGVLVLAMRRADGSFTTNPSPDTMIEPGQVLIAVGTDDGLVQVTRNDGESWQQADVSEAVPEMTYVYRLEPSVHDADTVYVVDGEVALANGRTPLAGSGVDAGASGAAASAVSAVASTAAGASEAGRRGGPRSLRGGAVCPGSCSFPCLHAAPIGPRIT